VFRRGPPQDPDKKTATATADAATEPGAPLPKDAAAIFMPTTARWGEGVEAAYNTYREARRMRACSDETYGPLFARCHHNAVKVATLLAIDENFQEPIIEMRHWELAVKLIDTSVDDLMEGLCDHEPDGKYTKMQDQLVAKIERSPQGRIGVTELFNSVHRSFAGQRDLFKNILLSLESAGKIRVTEGEKPKRGLAKKFVEIVLDDRRRRK